MFYFRANLSIYLNIIWHLSILQIYNYPLARIEWRSLNKKTFLWLLLDAQLPSIRPFTCIRWEEIYHLFTQSLWIIFTFIKEKNSFDFLSKKKTNIPFNSHQTNVSVKTTDWCVWGGGSYFRERPSLLHGISSRSFVHIRFKILCAEDSCNSVKEGD